MDDEPLSNAEKAERRRQKRRQALTAGLAACCGVFVLTSILILALILASSGNILTAAPEKSEGMGKGQGVANQAIWRI